MNVLILYTGVILLLSAIGARHHHSADQYFLYNGTEQDEFKCHSSS